MRALSTEWLASTESTAPAGDLTQDLRRPRPAAVSRRGRVSRLAIVAESIASARAAHLRYVTDTTPGITRRKSGKGFVYRMAEGGAPIRDEATLDRIRALVIPPAWNDVWICPIEDGHLQATGRDARGRKQYRYHARFRAEREWAKYGRLLLFGATLPRIRATVEKDLARRGLPRRKVLALIVRLLERTLIRIGNREYMRLNRSFGL